MGQGSYVVLLIAMAVVMAGALVAFAITFDTYVMRSDNVFPNLNLQEATSNLADGNVFDSVIAELQRLV